MRLEEVHKNMNMLEKKHFDLSQYNIAYKQEKDELKNNLFRKQIRYESQVTAMQRLDKEIEELIGKAVDMNDLEILTKLDLETLNSIRTEKDHHLNAIAENIAATRIQATYKGKKTRNDFKVKKFQQKRLVNKIGNIRKQKLEEIRWGAALVIQRLFRDRLKRKEYLKALDSKYPKKIAPKQKSPEHPETKEQAARKILKAWLRWRKAKGTDTAINRVAAAARIAIAQNLSGSTGEPLRLPEKVMCHICKENMAIRRCLNCADPELQMFCIQCYKTHHARGARKRHERQRIIYDGQPFDANASITTNKYNESVISSPGKSADLERSTGDAKFNKWNV